MLQKTKKSYRRHRSLAGCKKPKKYTELIFVTNIMNYIVEWRKNCHVEKFQLPIQNLNTLWSFIEVYNAFVPNLCGEKSAWRKSVWRKNDKYEVWRGTRRAAGAPRLRNGSQTTTCWWRGPARGDSFQAIKRVFKLCTS